MFEKWLGGRREQPGQSSAPEILGLALGGAFELDPLLLRILQPELLQPPAPRARRIAAVGRVELDADTELLRFYTEDDAYLQLVVDAPRSDSRVRDCKFWQFFDTRSVGSQKDWDELLHARISQPTYALEGHSYVRVWQDAGGESPAVAMTESTWTDGEAATATATDQFAMLYERVLPGERAEYLLVAGEETIKDHRAERVLVLSTGFDVTVAEILVVG